MILRPRTRSGRLSIARLPRVRKPMRLFGHWNNVMGRIAASRQVLLCLDFDGTLVASEPRPELVKLRAVTRRILARLARHHRVQVAIISARRRREIQSLVAIEGIRYLGLYGWERDEHAKLPALAGRALRQCHFLLAQRLRRF